MTTRAQTREAPRILDLSRTVARGAGRIPTGIDRAELAYLDRLHVQQGSAFGLIRTRFGFLLLDSNGLAGLSRAIADPSRLSGADVLSRIAHRLDPARARLETLARKLAIGRSTRRGLGALLQRRLPTGTEYLNVGHSNLTDGVFQAINRVPESYSTVVLHDLLPLTHPQFNRTEAVRKAERISQTISANANRVVHISTSARSSNEELLTRFGRRPSGLVAPLGIRTPVESGKHHSTNSGPFFLAVGTLEPRKNLGFLLDLWETMAGTHDFELPSLVLAGTRGWESDTFFQRLTGNPLYGTEIRWIESPADSEVDDLLLGAHGLLFPSHAEGQGLPPLEAASAGVPVICQRLPPLEELLGSYPIYRDCDDLAGWAEKIKDLLAGQTPQRLTVPDTLPTWERHFAVVFNGEIPLAAGGRADKGSA